MKMSRNLVALATLGALLATSAVAQEYPTDTVTFVVPFGAGGPTDSAARIVAEGLSSKLGQPVIIDNRPGAAAQIGAKHVATSDPDGYTLFIANSTSSSSTPVIKPSTSVDPIKDFDPVIGIAKYPSFLACNPEAPGNNTQEMAEYARQHPEEITITTTGVGSGAHFLVEMLAQTTGAKYLAVPYKGNAEATTAVLGGTANCIFAVGAAQYVEAGQMKALGTTGIERDSRLPSVPTLDEQGAKGFDYFTWIGVEAPKGTPTEIIEKLNVGINEVLKDPAVVEQLTALGMTILGGTPQDHEDLLIGEMEKHKKIATQANFSIE